MVPNVQALIGENPSWPAKNPSNSMSYQGSKTLEYLKCLKIRKNSLNNHSQHIYFLKLVVSSLTTSTKFSGKLGEKKLH
jgi:hypothetical protein